MEMYTHDEQLKSDDNEGGHGRYMQLLSVTHMISWDNLNIHLIQKMTVLLGAVYGTDQIYSNHTDRYMHHLNAISKV